MSKLSDPSLCRLVIKTGQIEAMEEALMAAGALSIFMASDGDMPLNDPRNPDLRYGDLIEAIFDHIPDDSFIVKIDARAHHHMEPITPTDWVSRSQENLPLITAPPFSVFGAHARPAHVSHHYDIELEAGAAFGSGHHATTQLCLTAIGNFIHQNGPNFAPTRPSLDLGCGSGILAIALAKSSTSAVIASDLDPQAIPVTRDNAARNGVGGRVKALCAAGFDHSDIRTHAPYPLIIANILAQPLCNLATAFYRHTEIGSTIILSGLLDHQIQRVRARFRAAGFVVLSQNTLEGWACLTLRR